MFLRCKENIIYFLLDGYTTEFFLNMFFYFYQHEYNKFFIMGGSCKSLTPDPVLQWYVEESCGEQ